MLNETTKTDTLVNMHKVTAVIKDIEQKGYQVHKVIIGNSGIPVIMLFKNHLCDDAIKTGKAFYQYLDNKYPLKQGVMLYDGCRCVWPESFY